MEGEARRRAVPNGICVWVYCSTSIVCNVAEPTNIAHMVGFMGIWIYTFPCVNRTVCAYCFCVDVV